MQYRRFGKTELITSVLTFGGMRIPGLGQDNATATLLRAVEVGINHIETARGYGESEELIGKAMPYLPREKLIITTKIGPTESADQMRRCLEESLTRLQVDYLDNFDLHGINTKEKLDLTLKKGGCLAAVRKAMDEGLVRHLGFSTHGPLEVILETLNTGEFESVNLHYYLFHQRNLAAVRRAAELDMGVFIISPTDKGGQLFNPPKELSQATAPYTPLQLNQRFLLSNPAVHTLSVGAARPQEFDAHLAMADQTGPLSEAEHALLARLQGRFLEKLGATYCSFCFECLPCPEKINIPEVLRLRNLTLALGMEEFGRYRYNLFEEAGEWHPGVKANKCTECGDCLPRCPLRLEIPKLLLETHALLSGEPRKRMWGEH